MEREGIEETLKSIRNTQNIEEVIKIIRQFNDDWGSFMGALLK